MLYVEKMCKNRDCLSDEAIPVLLLYEWVAEPQGKPALVNHNGTQYSYLYNLQGDVIGLVDNAGSLVVEYKYNAWGSITGRSGSLAATLGKLNPFRYRGYVYDEETWIYWLKKPVLRPGDAEVHLGGCGDREDRLRQWA